MAVSKAASRDLGGLQRALTASPPVERLTTLELSACAAAIAVGLAWPRAVTPLPHRPLLRAALALVCAIWLLFATVSLEPIVEEFTRPTGPDAPLVFVATVTLVPIVRGT